MAFTGTVTYDDVNYNILLNFDDQTQLDTFYAAYINTCRFLKPDINEDVTWHFPHDGEDIYLVDKAAIIAILAGL